MSEQALQSSRFEYKYWVDERQARAISDFLRAYLEPDDYLIKFGRETGCGYPVCSLYLDTTGLMLYGQTMQGQKNRFKLRIRFYDNNPLNPAFLENKRRETDVIKKKRAAVTREGAKRILAGEPPSPDFLYGGKVSAKSLDAMYDFCSLRDRISAGGCTYVYYHREAYVSPNSSQARVTFDRHLKGGIYLPGTDLTIPTDSVEPPVEGVILELKFTDRFPNWMRTLCEVFNLQKISIPKYVKCVDELRDKGTPARVEQRVSFL